MATYNCQAHVLNLLANDLAKERGREQVISNTVTVLKAFKNTHSLAAAIKEMGVTRPILPSPTRWASHRDALRYYNANWAFLAQVCFAFKLVFYNKCCPLKGRGYETQTQRQRPQNT